MYVEGEGVKATCQELPLRTEARKEAIAPPAISVPRRRDPLQDMRGPACIPATALRHVRRAEGGEDVYKNRECLFSPEGNDGSPWEKDVPAT